jgi:HSP20 family protein
MSTDFSRLIQSWLTPSGTAWHEVHWTPAVDVYRVAAGWLVKFDLAGVRPSDIRLNVCGRQLTVSGRRRDWVVEESRSCSAYSMEITYSQFERTLELPGEIEHLQIRTEYRDGMLLVRLEEQGSAG